MCDSWFSNNRPPIHIPTCSYTTPDLGEVTTGLVGWVTDLTAAFALYRRGLHKIEHVQGIALKQEMVVYH